VVRHRQRARRVAALVLLVVAARPPAPTTSLPAAVEFTPPVSDPAPAESAPSIPAEAPISPSGPLGILPGSPKQPGGSEATDVQADSAQLALALSGLIHDPVSHRPDRRAVAFMAVALLMADGVLMASLRRRGVRLAGRQL